jgi:hypothetical protein
MWSFSSYEASLSVTLNTSAGTTDVPNGAQLPITATVQRFTWEVWVSDMNHTEIREYSGGPRAGATVYFSTAAGSLSSWGGATGGDGAMATTLTMPAAATVVSAVVTDSDSATTLTASASLGFSPPVPDPETWSYLRSESLLSAALSVSGALTDVPDGATRQAQIHVKYDTWDVYVSNYNHLETRNPASSPASYATVSWSVGSGETGSVTGAAGQADANGDSSVTFTMGSAASTLLAEVSYAGSISGVTSAAVTFTAPALVEQWHLDHAEGYISAPLSANGSLSDVTNGMQRTVTADVQYTSWEIWVSDMNHSEIRNQTTGPAIEAALTFTVSSGDGSITTTSATTDVSGRASTTFTMGSSDSQVIVSASFAGAAASGALVFTVPVPETWSYSRTESLLSAALSVPEGETEVPSGATRQVNLHAQINSWEVWVSNKGNTQTCYPSWGPASSTAVSWSINSGTVSGNSQTDSNGDASASFTMGSEASTLTASVGSASAAVTFQLPTTEQWSFDHQVSTITVSLGADGPVTGVPSGAQRGITANVQLSSWEVWVSTLGNTREQNPTSGVAAGAALTFSIETGGGSISTAGATTDASGNATTTYTMGSQGSRLAVSASFASATATGSLDFSTEDITLETWEYHHTDSSLSLSVSASGSASVAYMTSEILISNKGNYKTGTTTSSPVSGASVGFAIASGGDATLSSSSASTDGSGNASTTITRGTVTSTLEASTSFGGLSAAASVAIPPVYIPPVEIWTKVGMDGTLSLTLSASGASVTYTSWKNWASDMGHTEVREFTTGPAIGAPVSFSVTGDAIINSSASATDSAGFAAVSVIGGSAAETLSASATFAAMSAPTPPPVVVPFLDSDNDGYSNAAEITAGTNPFLASSFPGSEIIIEYPFKGMKWFKSESLVENWVVITRTASWTTTDGGNSADVTVALAEDPSLNLNLHLALSPEIAVTATETSGWVKDVNGSGESQSGITLAQFQANPPVNAPAVLVRFIDCVETHDGVPIITQSSGANGIRITLTQTNYTWDATMVVKL